jgi:hypothetical protein
MGNEETFELDDIVFDNMASDTGTVTISTLSEPSITLSTDYTFDTVETIDISSLTSSITISDIPFIDSMPDLDKVQKMCDHYPALAKAYENFKTIYKMVDQDYKGNYEDDDELPF